MDKTIPAKEDSSELTRELLIAISESSPDQIILEPTPVHENPYGPNGTELAKEAREDKLRSDLISISYSPSPDKIAVPISPSPPTQS